MTSVLPQVQEESLVVCFSSFFLVVRVGAMLFLCVFVVVLFVFPQLSLLAETGSPVVSFDEHGSLILVPFSWFLLFMFC